MSLTCHTNGKLFKFNSAKIIARNFHTPARPAKPSLLRRVDKEGAITDTYSETVVNNEDNRVRCRWTFDEGASEIQTWSRGAMRLYLGTLY